MLDFNKADQQKQEEEKKQAEDNSDGEDEDNRISKVIKLKRNLIRDDFFAYVRMSLMQKFEKDNKMKEHILVSSPVDIEFEMFMLALAINLLNSLLSNRFNTSVAEDDEILQNKDLPYRRRLAVMYRRESKLILHSNIKLCNILMHILARL